MVWKDFETEDLVNDKAYLQKLRKSVRLAHPTDRIASCVVDIAISVSVSSLLAAPIHKEIQKASLLGESSRLFFFAVIAVFIHVGFFVFFNAYFVSRYQQSLGQKIFGVRIVQIWSGQSLSFSRALLRAFFWFFEMLFIFPLAAVFSDPYRRVLHERLTDSISLATHIRYAKNPSPQEKSFVKGILLPAYLWIFAITVSLFSSFSNEFLKEDLWLAKLDKAIPYCEEVVDAASSWPKEVDQEKESRLLVALSLYSADIVGKDCLMAEADAAFLRKQEIEFAYLAKSFATESKTELSDEYLIKVCENGKENTEACLFSKVIRHWANNENTKADKVLQSLIGGSHSFVKNWGIKFYIRNKNFEKAYALIDTQSVNKNLASFLAENRVKNLWAMGKERESIVSFQSSRASLDSLSERKTNAWLCWNLSKNSCSALEQSACKGISDWQPVGEKFQTEEVLAIVNHSECFTRKSKLDIANQLMGQTDAYERSFLKAYAGLENNFMEILVHGIGSSMDADLRAEIFRRLLKEQTSVASLKKLQQLLYLEDKESLSWEESASDLLTAFYKMNQTSEAKIFTEQLLSQGDISQYSRDQFLSLKNKFENGLKLKPINLRIPASISNDELGQ